MASLRRIQRDLTGSRRGGGHSLLKEVTRQGKGPRGLADDPQSQTVALQCVLVSFAGHVTHSNIICCLWVTSLGGAHSPTWRGCDPHRA